MTETFKSKINRLFDRIIEQLLAIEDFLCLTKQNVRASEITLFAASFLSFLWIVLFDVQDSSPALRYIFSEAAWGSIFGVFSVMHLAGVWVPLWQFRQVAVYGYAIIWFVWLVMTASATHASLVVPLVFIAMCLSIYVSVCLSREKKESEP